MSDPVLGRRAHALPALPATPSRYAREVGYLRRAVRDERHPLRAGARVRARRRRRPASAWPTSSSTASTTRPTPPQGRQPLRREAARDREPRTPPASTSSSSSPSSTASTTTRSGRIVDFAIDNADKVTVVSFQPVSFTGRDEDIADEQRAGAALHAEPPRARHARRRRGVTEPHARLVPALGDGPVQRPHRSCSWASAPTGAR